MKTIFRMLPVFAAAFVLGVYMESSAFANATKTAKETTTGLVMGAALIACLILCAMTRGKKASKKQQSGGFGYARARTGRS